MIKRSAAKIQLHAKKLAKMKQDLEEGPYHYRLGDVVFLKHNVNTRETDMRIPVINLIDIADILYTVAETWHLQDDTMIGHPPEYLEYLSAQLSEMVHCATDIEATCQAEKS